MAQTLGAKQPQRLDIRSPGDNLPGVFSCGIRQGAVLRSVWRPCRACRVGCLRRRRNSCGTSRIRAAGPRHWPDRGAGFALRPAVVLIRQFARTLRPGHPPRRTLSHRRSPGPGRNGRGLSCGRSEARSACRAQVPSGVARSGPGAPRAVPVRGPARAAGRTQERLPDVRRRRRRRPSVPDDGVCRRGGSGLAAPPDWTAARRQGARPRTTALCRALRPRTSAGSCTGT